MSSDDLSRFFLRFSTLALLLALAAACGVKGLPLPPLSAMPQRTDGSPAQSPAQDPNFIGPPSPNAFSSPAPGGSS